MKKDVENEIEELLAQIENKYKDQNEISFINFIGLIFKKLNILRFLSVILIITLSVLMITNGVIILEFFIISSIFLAVAIIGYLVYSHYQQPVKDQTKYHHYLLTKVQNHVYVLQDLQMFLIS